MEAIVVDAGSKLLKAGAAIPDQFAAMIIPSQINDAMEDLFVYSGLGWEERNEGNILFTDPLCTLVLVIKAGLYASEQAVLSLYAVGRISGCC